LRRIVKGGGTEVRAKRSVAVVNGRLPEILGYLSGQEIGRTRLLYSCIILYVNSYGGTRFGPTSNCI